jgi:membrane-associated phospholipid phosphatase
MATTLARSALLDLGTAQARDSRLGQIDQAVIRAIARPRPPADQWLIEPEDFSPPSRHTALAALTAGACGSAAGAGSVASQIAALVIAAGVGAGRAYVGGVRCGRA